MGNEMKSQGQWEAVLIWEIPSLVVPLVSVLNVETDESGIPISLIPLSILFT